MPDREGTLVLVIGPSGAGKDTLIDHARHRFDNGRVVFVRRVVTRPAGPAEAHTTLDRAAFAREAAHGAFAFQWHAHGLAYAIPATIVPDLAAGRTVVCNVSRGVVEDLRQRFARVCVIYVDAPLPIRLARIAGRDRAGEGPGRASRDGAFRPADADHVVDNGGALDAASARFDAILAELLTS